jgi:predicted ribonuclease toxin of YeeF-YezG toxin-antitoxin module
LYKKPKYQTKPLEFDDMFKEYLKDIEDITSNPIPRKQKKLLKLALETKKYYKLSTENSKKHRSEYNSLRKDLIKDWEVNTGKRWGTYVVPVYSKNGKIIRREGGLFDVHHIIECSWGGDNKWWNIHPAKHPDEHQQGIHRKSGYAHKIFN